MALIGLDFAKPASAQAATISQGGIDTAKKVLQNAAQGTVLKSNDVAQSDNYIRKPLITDTQITLTPKPTLVAPSIPLTKKVVKTTTISTSDTSAHRFPYGYCTSYVAEHRFVPWSGNAISWLSGAKSFGFATGNTPAVGAIMVTSEGGRTGHVALVDSVNDGTITVSEMNYAGFGKISSRTISAVSNFIMGFIY